MQQWALLRQEGILNPDPIKIFYKDLEDLLTGWRIILMMDANEPIGKSPGGLTLIMGKAGMSDILRFKHQNIENLNTYARGSQQIDFIFCTENILPHCQRAGALPFGTGYHSDHKALFITINFEDFFNTKLGAIDTIAARKLIQASPKERQKFMELVDTHFQNQNLYERLRNLMAIPSSEWNSEHSIEYEKCDQQ
jgi:hypothetical protein